MKFVSNQDMKFLLKDACVERQTLINLVFRFNNGRFKSSTGLAIESYQWDSERQCAHINQKSRIAREPFETINAQLERCRSALKTVLSRLQLAQVTFTNEVIKQQLDTELGRIKKQKPVLLLADHETFTSYIERFVSEAETGKRLNAQNSHYALFTLKGYLKLKRLLKNYRVETGNPIDYAGFSLDFYHMFKLWLISRGLTLNYIGSLMKDLKIMLRHAHSDRLHTNLIFQHKDFKKFSEEVDSVYLSE